MNLNNDNSRATVNPPNRPSVSSNVVEWVEIVEPQTKQHMYANLITGQCSWEPPPGNVPTNINGGSCLIRRRIVTTTIMPPRCERSGNDRWGLKSTFIPLAKLQTLKENTESAEHARVRRTCENTNIAGYSKSSGRISSCDCSKYWT
ncbi:hypothetical protein KIN20_019789 [Parelaphostrongylus tenuis]|uniref:WW domain-containing protein n=1 Tax=Parelaphostrongylus tenuis TaxID=148309 RepID=A0AAD5MLM6_PARTN|nr:hypothetical protein KIN20_019789 [Parelaphostrongylus tenuis]